MATSTPPTRIPIADVCLHAWRKYALKITRQTAYNWARHGKNGVTLKTVRLGGTLFTTKEWVDEFLHSV